jgi:hypothetical protein
MLQRAVGWAAAATLLLGGGSVMAAPPPALPVVPLASVGPNASPNPILVASNPPSYASAFQNAISYLVGQIASNGAVTAGDGQPATATSSAWAAVALARNGKLSLATAIAAHLIQAQTASGGWNQTLQPSATASLGATVHVLWALDTIAEIQAASVSTNLTTALTAGANAL